MPRITLTFLLSDPRFQLDLLHEFSLHDDVEVTASETDEGVYVSVETTDSPPTVWDVRATIGMFDEKAVETDGPHA